MSQLPLPVGKQEFHDGTAWYAIASENFVLNNLRIVPPCFVATTANLTATYANGAAGVGATLTNSGTQSAIVIDGVTIAVGSRVLVKDQTSGLQNGIYAVTNTGSASTNWILTRAIDYDSTVETVRGGTVSVISGTINQVSLWMLISTITTIGTDSFTFAKTDQNSFTSILGTTNQINVSVSSGVATISIVSNPVLPGTASVTIPTGTTVQRPSTPTVGMIRFNTSL